MAHIKLYDSDMNLIAILENATEKGYTKKLNDLWQATFSMPANDPKTKLCTPFSIIEMFDGDERIDLFRILPSTRSTGDVSEKITFNCEHVLATLVDDILFQYHEQNNQTTINTLNYILGFQSTQKWKLGVVHFSHQFSYKWESENLLGSLFSVPKPFIDDYQWTWDTTTMPWTLNLIRPSTQIKTWVRYRRNLKGIEKRTDPTDLCTRLYGLGYGEGVNQLTISEINNGLPYIDSDTISTYGIISRIYTDTKEENVATLKSKMQSYLEQLKLPRYEYSVSAAHLYQITHKSIDDFYIGGICMVIDKEDDMNFASKVVSISKSSIDESPGDIELEIANKPEDIASSMSSLADRQRINEVYAQGATNLLAQDFADNCDPQNPAIIRFYIPEETVRINKMELNYKTSSFRAYSKAIMGGGAVMATTTAGGSTVGSSGPGMWTLDPPQFLPGDFMERNDSHDHGGTDSASGVGLPSHYHDIPSDGDHTHSMYSVTHDHEVELPDHFHELELLDHTHDIEYGIYLNPVSPESISVIIDDTPIPSSELNADGLNIIPYLSVDSDGKINRGTWHEIKITPNALARIEANIVTQLFIQSRGGGNY